MQRPVSPQLNGLVLEFVVGQLAEVFGEVIDGFCIVLELAKKAPFTYTKDALEYVSHHLLHNCSTVGALLRDPLVTSRNATNARGHEAARSPTRGDSVLRSRRTRARHPRARLDR